MNQTYRMYKALYNSPMIPSYDLEGTGAFFTDILGFSVEMASDTYAIYSKDNLTIHLLRAGDDIGQMEFYLEVDDLESFWNQIRDHIAHLKHRPPFEREYGMREVHIEVPFTNTLMFIGQEIRK